MQSLHLCAGIGCGMLADLIVGNTPVAAVDIDPFCCGILRDRAAEGWFPGLEVHECDLRTFDPAPLAGRVDQICGGWPCQGISRIGSRQGLADERSGLWSHFVRIARVLRPTRMFLENGPDLVVLGLDRVLADLASLGYDARWGIVAAAESGASHGRDRWWCVADAVRDGWQGKCGGGGQRRRQLSAACFQAMADADAARPHREPEGRVREPHLSFWYDADGCLRDPPGRDDVAAWEAARRHGAPEPGIRRMADAAAWRVVKARVAAIGNGQDPLQAALAYSLLTA